MHLNVIDWIHTSQTFDAHVSLIARGTCYLFVSSRRCMGVAGWVPVHVGIKLMEIEGTCSLTAAAHDAHRSWGVVAKLNCWF